MADNLKLDLEVDVQVQQAQELKALHAELTSLEADISRMASNTEKAFRGIGAAAKAVAGIKLKGPTDTGAREGVESERDLYAELRKRWTFERRMAAQRKSEAASEASAAAAADRDVEARFRSQLAWNTRIAAQRAREERAADAEVQRGIRETARMRDKEARKALDDARALRREQEKAAAQLTKGAGQVRSGVGRAVVAGGAVAAGAVYASKRGLDRLTRAGVNADAAMNENARLESAGLSPQEARAKVEKTREEYKPLGRRLGTTVPELMSTRSAALQAGVSSDIVDSVVKDATKYAILNGLKPSDVAESSGYGLTALSAHGTVTAARASNLFNKQQYLAQTTAASRVGLASFVRRGLSAGAMAGFSDDDTLAYGAAGTAAGQDGESVARALGSTQERLAGMPTRAADIGRKKHKTLADRRLLTLPKKLGFESWKQIKQQFSKDAAGVTEKLYEGLGAINDPQERLELSEALWGKEFAPMHSAMAAGSLFKKMRQATRSTDAANALDNGMKIEDTSFPMIMRQITTTIGELTDDLGLELKGYYSDLRDWILKTPKAFSSFREAFKSGLSGLMSGLGSSDGTMGGLLKAWMGDPTSFTVNAKAVGDFMRGIGAGIREIGGAIRSFVGLFAGQNATPEELGKWTTRILGLSAALVVAAPAISIMGGLATAITGFATMAAGAAGILRAAGLMGGTAGAGASAGATAGAGAGILGTLGRLVPAIAAPLTMDPSRADQNRLTSRLGRWAQEQENARNGIPGRATGGWISGAGTGTSDSILARLSHGEFVVNAASASRYGGLLESINGGRLPAFALGGSVGGVGSGSPFAAMRAGEDMRRLADAIGDLVRVLRIDAYGRFPRTRGGGFGAGATGVPGVGAGPPEAEPSSIMGRTIARGRHGLIGGGLPAGAGSPNAQFSGTNAAVLKQAASMLGTSASDLATVISYETAGTFDPSKRGGRGGNYQGLIQFGPNERAKYGVTGRETFAEQMPKVVQFLKDRGFKPGMDLNQLYATINGGNPYVSQGASDGNGTIAGHVERMRREHGNRAQAFLNAGDGGAGSGPLAGLGGSSRAVDTARGLVGAGSSQAAAALGSRMTPGNWCADFVNGALRSANIRGVNSSIANSFLGWGQQVMDGVKAGDVVVTHRGRGVGQVGGHVGLATGETRMKNGRLQYQTVSGNHGNRVGVGWEYADSVALRRAQESNAQAQATANAARGAAANPEATEDIANPAGTPPSAPLGRRLQGNSGNGLIRNRSIQGSNQVGNTPYQLGANTPMRGANERMMGGQNGGGGGNVIHVNVNAANHSPQEMAAAVQRHLQDTMQRRVHDYDGFA